MSTFCSQHDHFPLQFRTPSLFCWRELRANAFSEPIGTKISLIKPGKLYKIVSKPATPFPIPPDGAQAGNPAALGGSVTVTANNTSLTCTLAAQAYNGTEGWKGLDNPAGSKGWKYLNKLAPGGGIAGACKLVLIKEKVIKVLAKGTGGLLVLGGGLNSDVSMDLSAEGDVYCALALAGTHFKEIAGSLLKMKNQPAPTECPEPVVDADKDGFAGTTESYLGSDPSDAASTPESIAIPSTCSDYVDNDLDSLTDADDPGYTPTRLSIDTFPAAGLDVFDSSLSLDAYELETEFGICPVDFEARGPTCVQRADPVDLGGGKQEINVEIISMQLTGTATILPDPRCILPPISVTVTLREDLLQRSTGKVTEQGPDLLSDFPADSFFDVFFLIDIPLLGTITGGPPGGPQGSPVRVENFDINSIPPYNTPDNPCLNPNCYAVPLSPHLHCPVPPPFLDHFKVYEVDDQPVSIAASLEDQFDTASPQGVLLEARDLFANPVKKTVDANVVEIHDPLAHLTMVPVFRERADTLGGCEEPVRLRHLDCHEPDPPARAHQQGEQVLPRAARSFQVLRRDGPFRG